MASQEINGTVNKTGTRVTSTDRGVRVEDVFDITIEPSVEQETMYKNDPAELVRRLLAQEGLPFKDVIVRDVPISHLRTAWFHIVYDSGNPGAVCTWHLYSY